jgi:hypothetical protein
MPSVVRSGEKKSTCISNSVHPITTSLPLYRPVFFVVPLLFYIFRIRYQRRSRNLSRRWEYGRRVCLVWF